MGLGQVKIVIVDAVVVEAERVLDQRNGARTERLDKPRRRRRKIGQDREHVAALLGEPLVAQGRAGG